MVDGSRELPKWLDESVAAEPPQLMERMRGVVLVSFQHPSQAVLCHYRHTVQLHSHHRAGLAHQPAQFVGTTSPDATSPAHHSKEDNTGHYPLVEDP